MGPLTKLILALVFISTAVVGIALFMSDLNSKYQLASFNDSQINGTYDHLEELSLITHDFENRSNIKEKSGVTDIIGSYFTDGYNAMVVTKKSYDVVDSMKNDAIKQMKLGPFGNNLNIAIGTALLLLIIGVIVSAIVKWQM